ncbi:MAG: carbon-monoxide dehydrogenase small subunit [Gammaproteobacteria bacterium]
MIPINLNINGEDCPTYVKPHWSLAYVIREKIGLTGTKTGCEMGTCGSCTVLFDGKPIFSCLRIAADAEGHKIQTIEGIETDGVLHPLQAAFIEDHGMQCGFCTPGMIVAAKALLDKNPDPSEQEVKEAIGGHLCRCGTYVRIVKSILHGAEIARNSK